MATVLMTTSEDEAHSGEMMLTSDPREFWVSTGLFPQEVIVQLNPARAIRSVRLVSSSIRQVAVEGCEAQSLGTFAKIGEDEFGHNRGGLQRESVSISQSKPYTFVKLVILSGWDNFVSIHGISFE